MNLKKEISKFRSEILVGQYDSAIAMSRNIMSQIEVLMALKIIKDDRLYNHIQEEYEKCLSIKSFIHNKIRSTEEAAIKKWGNKQQVSKWKKKEEVNEKPGQQRSKSRDQKRFSPIKTLDNQSLMDLLGISPEKEERHNRFQRDEK